MEPMEIDVSAHRNGELDEKPNIYLRGLRRQSALKAIFTAASSIPSPGLSNGHSSYDALAHDAKDRSKRVTKGWSKFVAPVSEPPSLVRHQQHLAYLEKFRAQKEQEKHELSDSEISLEWNEDYRDAYEADSWRKAETKSARRRCDIRRKSEFEMKEEMHQRELEGEEFVMDDPVVDPYSKELRMFATPRYVARYMDVCRVEIGTRVAVKVVGLRDGLCALSWDEIEIKRAEFENFCRENGLNEGDSVYNQGSEEFPIGICAWDHFPGEILMVQEGSGQPYKRAILLECFKRARQLDVLLMDYGYRKIRVGTEAARTPPAKVRSNPKWRKFYVCLFKPSTLVPIAWETKLKDASPENPVAAEVLCHKQEGKVCFGEIRL